VACLESVIAAMPRVVWYWSGHEYAAAFTLLRAAFYFVFVSQGRQLQLRARCRFRDGAASACICHRRSERPWRGCPRGCWIQQLIINCRAPTRSVGPLDGAEFLFWAAYMAMQRRLRFTGRRNYVE
jgi:hypothetical protein